MTALILKRTISLFLAACLFLELFAQTSNFQFIENKGQLDNKAKFMGEIGSGAFFLEKKGFTVLLHNPEDLMNIMHRHHGFKSNNSNESQGSSAVANNNRNGVPPGPDGIRTSEDEITLHSHAYKVSFEGASENVLLIPEKMEEQYNNYINGNDPSKWATNCKIFRTVLYKNMYPGVDVRYYSENGQLKYDLIVAPGVDPGVITMKYQGVNKLSIRNNTLNIETTLGTTSELAPYSYQFDNEKGRVEVSCKFQIVNDSIVKFRVKNYKTTLPLVIDPSLIFSTFTGGASNYGFTATPGPGGTLFSGSIVFSNGFPTTTGAFQTRFAGGGGTVPTDIGIIKFNATGTTRLYATYLGGSNDDYPHSIISDPQGNLVVMGRTYSGDGFPKSLKKGDGGGADIFVAKLNATGTALLGALVIGGTGNDGVNMEDQIRIGAGADKSTSILRFYGDDSRSEVNLDKNGNIYVAAQSQSTNFPVTAGVFQPSSAGGQDGVVMKIDPNCSNVLFGSYLGGSGNDGAFVIDINPKNGDVYVAGATTSMDLKGSSSSVWQSTYQGGGSDGYLSVISSDGSSLLRTTYLGTAGYDAVYGIKFDKFGLPYVMGITQGNWPVINAGYSNPNSSQFVAKLPNSLGAPIYSTVFGSGVNIPNISPVAFLVDRCENVYVSGWGGWLFPTLRSTDPYGQAGVVGMPVTSDALKGTSARESDNRDFYFIVLKKNAAGILYGSAFGQSGGDGEHVDGGTSRFDAQGTIYQAICANCGGSNGGRLPITLPYRVTPGVVAPVNGGLPSGCNLGALKISFDYAGVASGVRSVVRGRFDTSGCVPLNVIFRDTIQNAKSYEWDFDGDGKTDLITDGNQFEAPFTYNAIGTYRLRLIAVDSTTCNMRDTSYINVRVRNDEAFPAVTVNKIGDCQSLQYAFNNAGSVPAAGKPFKRNSFKWNFDDKSPEVTTGVGTINHTFPAPGTYRVQMILIDTNYCNAPDTVFKELRVSPLVKAQFETPMAGCVPYMAAFKNTSLGGQTFVWDFGDGTTSTDANPQPKLYANPGTYTITLTANDPFTCNKTSTSPPFTLVVSDRPKASFTFSPITPVENFPYTFTNTSSSDAVRFKWLFGDGDSLITIKREPVEHLYNSSGRFTVSLIAYNVIGCADTAKAEVVSIVIPMLDVPNAFTPAGPNNNVVYVRGFGIGKMRWRIYNRFGNMVFESANRNQGWDGRYKGSLLPMDAYAYTLEVEFTDGARTTKRGDITLLR